ncbi:MAG: Cys-tRNA(Pro) deacylase [Actinomycetaceae bacterium]|nr:Cys-tRNA(Pro) deacylase [Actinomycetaceae bacterium]MDY6082641.1 Cys-tRNA(Pro) deacylase [Actinomycetaceae bacterium]
MDKQLSSTYIAQNNQPHTGSHMGKKQAIASSPLGRKLRGHPQAATPALAVLQEAGVAFHVYEYEHSLHRNQGWALDSAAVLDLPAETIFKSLMTEVDGKALCAVIPANSMLNMKKLAHAVHGKHAAMMDQTKAERLTGYVKGGISPLGQKEQAPVMIDESAIALDVIHISGGKRSLTVGIAPWDLEAVAHAAFADIADHGRHA